jgi:hypothetical protein
MQQAAMRWEFLICAGRADPQPWTMVAALAGQRLRRICRTGILQGLLKYDCASTRVTAYQSTTSRLLEGCVYGVYMEAEGLRDGTLRG